VNEKYCVEKDRVAGSRSVVIPISIMIKNDVQKSKQNCRGVTTECLALADSLDKCVYKASNWQLWITL